MKKLPKDWEKVGILPPYKDFDLESVWTRGYRQGLLDSRDDLKEWAKKNKKRVYAIGTGSGNDHNTYYDLALDDLLEFLK